MNKPIEAKKSPEVKPWVRRVVEAAGVFMPSNADGERRLGSMNGTLNVEHSTSNIERPERERQQVRMQRAESENAESSSSSYSNSFSERSDQRGFQGRVGG